MFIYAPVSYHIYCTRHCPKPSKTNKKWPLLNQEIQSSGEVTHISQKWQSCVRRSMIKAHSGYENTQKRKRRLREQL